MSVELSQNVLLSEMNSVPTTPDTSTGIGSCHVAPTAPTSVVKASLPVNEKAHDLIFQALKTRVQSINQDTCDAGAENSFFVCDLGEVTRLLNYWKARLPRVQPFYAVKCNPNIKVLEKLGSMGVNFDCASKAEIEKVLSLGVDPKRIIYANPCKASSFIRFAASKQVEMLTFDNTEELHKVAKFHPQSKVILRIATDDSTAQCSLSSKYGCSLDRVDELLYKVKGLGLNLVGVSFHMGSGATDFSSLIKAVADSRYVFDRSKELGLQPLTILDVGGGFQLESFHESSEALNTALEQYFPSEDPCFRDLEVIAEPGRFLVATSFVLASHVIAKRRFDGKKPLQTASPDASNEEAMIYINDGIYANMNCILFDHQDPTPKVLYHNKQFHYTDPHTTSKSRTTHCPFKVSIWGPTCDGLDCITREYYMKYDLTIGDWMYFPNFGAYTSSAATPFNGFDQCVDVIYIDSEES